MNRVLLQREHELYHVTIEPPRIILIHTSIPSFRERAATVRERVWSQDIECSHPLPDGRGSLKIHDL